MQSFYWAQERKNQNHKILKLVSATPLNDWIKSLQHILLQMWFCKVIRHLFMYIVGLMQNKNMQYEWKSTKTRVLLYSWFTMSYILSPHLLPTLQGFLTLHLQSFSYFFLTYITSTYESRPKMGHQMLILHVLINLSPKVKINKLTLTPGWIRWRDTSLNYFPPLPVLFFSFSLLLQSVNLHHIKGKYLAAITRRFY